MNDADDIARPWCALPTDALRRRLRELAGAERELQVEFLSHLAEFDERRAFADAGFDSLWNYCLRELHLREGAAARRIAAMRVLRRHPALEAPLRDGRLCLSTVTLVASLVPEHDIEDLVARATYKTKAEVEHLVASLRPYAVPRDGVRLVSSRPTAMTSLSLDGAPAGDAEATNIASSANSEREADQPSSSEITSDSEPPASSAGLVVQVRAAPPRPELRPISQENWSLRVTMDSQMKEDLDTLQSLLSHKLGRDLTEVVREALRCAVEKHGKRRGAVAPRRTRARRRPERPGAGPDAASAGPDRAVAAPDRPSADPDLRRGTSAPQRGRAGAGDRDPLVDGSPGRDCRCSRAIPAEVRRAVWKRDDGCCAWVSGDGRRCRSRWKLEFDHIVPVRLGGPPTIENVRVTCRAHNLLHAERTLGRALMDRYRTPRRAGSSSGSPSG